MNAVAAAGGDALDVGGRVWLLGGASIAIVDDCDYDIRSLTVHGPDVRAVLDAVAALGYRREDTVLDTGNER
ncbi:MAG: hypothetical protein ACRDRN_21050 [Sciscionella sp.]